MTTDRDRLKKLAEFARAYPKYRDERQYAESAARSVIRAALALQGVPHSVRSLIDVDQMAYDLQSVNLLKPISEEECEVIRGMAQANIRFAGNPDEGF